MHLVSLGVVSPYPKIVEPLREVYATPCAASTDSDVLVQRELHPCTRRVGACVARNIAWRNEHT